MGTDFLTFLTSKYRVKHTHTFSNGMFCFPMLKIRDNVEGPNLNATFVLRINALQWTKGFTIFLEV